MLSYGSGTKGHLSGNISSYPTLRKPALPPPLFFYPIPAPLLVHNHEVRPMPEKPSLTEFITNFFSLVPLVMYMIVAVMLTIIAVFYLYDSALVIYQLIVPPTLPVNLIDVINALLLTITIIVLFETVTVYFRTKHVEVRALLIAGLTGMVRHILVYNMENIEPMTMFATVSLLAVLIAGIVLVRPESPG